MNMKDYKQLVKELNEKREVLFEITGVDNIFLGHIRLKNDIEVALKIVFPSSFPLRIPAFYVETNGLSFLHTDADGKMCLYEESSILLNQRDALGILLECYDKAIEILSVSPESTEYQNEIKREFDAYWLSISKRHVYSCIETSKITYSVKCISWVGSKYVLTDSKEDGQYLLYNYFKENKKLEFLFKECLIIRLRDNSPLPKIGELRWKDVRRYIVSNISGSHKRQFKDYCKTVIKKATKHIILVLPSDRGDILFGYQINVSNKRYIRFDNCTNAEIEPLYITRIDRSYLLERAGSNSDMHDKNVLLLGCGSVGGFIADNLCAAGIGGLDILDEDVFRTENVHRHLLGIDAALIKPLRNKADILKEKLEAKYLYTDIDSLSFKDRSAESFISDIKRLEHYDVIVSALGEPTLNLEINKILHENHIGVPFVICFNEPYGIGGHVISSNITRKSCLRCLYTDAISSDLVEYRGSFVKPGQSFKKNISGCGSAFVPYNRLDSQQTAILATRLITDILIGNVEENTVKSWVGEKKLLYEAGKKESHYYNRQTPGNIVTMYIQKNSNCPICGEGNDC